jgi:alkanesulfonate monooxygenase SsuD/methylene tetrahydromethanopterin reductase-like flavin-dependent oxidoreductase (luciferase family)
LGAAERIDRYAVAGTPVDCAAAFRRLTEAGATSLIVVPQMADHEQQLRRLVDDVLPLLT